MGWRETLAPGTPRKDRKYGKDEALPPSYLSCISDLSGGVPDPGAESRRQRVLAMLRESPSIKYAVAVDDPDSDPVVLALGVRGAMQDGSTVTCELHIPHERYDLVLLVDWLNRHGSAVH